MSHHSFHTDIRHDGFISRFSEPWHSYALLARLDRPVGTWLLFLPGAFGIFLANGTSLKTRFFYISLFAIGSLVMRSAGCVINDIWDRDIDAKVSRTAGRPLASGALSLRQGFLLLFWLLLVGLIILIALPPICWALAPIALLLVALYPAAKRITWWPQLMMGFTFGFGAPMGYAASHGSLDFPGWILYAGVVIWQLGFDTIYGFQDMEDDARIGVKSTSQRMLNYAKPFIGGCYFFTLICFGLSAIWNHLSFFFWIGFIPAALWMFYQIFSLTPHNAPACLKKFRHNVPIGILLATGFILGRIIPL